MKFPSFILLKEPPGTHNHTLTANCVEMFNISIQRADVVLALYLVLYHIFEVSVDNFLPTNRVVHPPTCKQEQSRETASESPRGNLMDLDSRSRSLNPVYHPCICVGRQKNVRTIIIVFASVLLLFSRNLFGASNYSMGC